MASPIDAHTVFYAFRNIILLHGFPIMVRADYGTNLLNNSIMTELCDVLGIAKQLAYPGHHQGTGLAEKNIFIATQILRKLCKKTKSWTRYINEVAFVMNTSVNRATNKSAYELIFGFKPRTLLDQIISSNEPINELYVQDLSDDDIVSRLLLRLETLFKEVDSHFDRYRQIQVKYLQKGSKQKDYNIGDIVMVYFPYITDKLDSHWRAPFRILEVLPNNGYKVVQINSDKMYDVHNERILPFNLNHIIAPSSLANIPISSLEERNVDQNDRNIIFTDF